MDFINFLKGFQLLLFLQKTISIMRKRFHLALILSMALLTVACRNDVRHYHIGVSQCSEDIWRDKLNKEMLMTNYINNNVDIDIQSANDNSKKQIEQINDFIRKKVDLLIVAPNQLSSISSAIDKAYRAGIPVIMFDRKTNTDKYTAFIGADNVEVGRSMGKYIAGKLNGNGIVVEIIGLKGSSPAADRHKGFIEAVSNYPGIHVISLQGNWKENNAYDLMKRFLRKNPHINCVFGHNDRQAFGAYRAAKEQGLAKKIMFMGVDGLPTRGGGIECVQKGIFSGTYIYPTRGTEVMNLAKKILEHKPYHRENLLKSFVVTKDNADMVMIQNQELERQGQNIDLLHHKVSSYLKSYNNQKIIIFLCVILVILLLVSLLSVYRIHLTRIRMNEKNEAMAKAQLTFFTNVSHQIRTPLTLIADPIDHIASRGKLEEGDMETLQAVDRNVKYLMTLVNNILDFKDVRFDEAGNRIAGEDKISDTNVPEVMDGDFEKNIEECSDGMTSILIVDDNKDIRDYVRSILISDYKVWVAADGEEGLMVARTKEPDLIISDVMMPKMDGLEMTRAIKSDVAISHIPVLLLTAKSEEEQIVSGFESGAIAYLTKPFSSKVLLARIKQIILEQNRLRRQIAAKMQHYMESGPAEDPAAQSLEKHLAIRDKVFLEKLNAILDKEMGDSGLSVERIGMDIGLSRVQLYRKVKAMTGMSPVELLRKVRLNRARVLLQKTDKTVSEVAYKVGFSAPSYFSKCYKDEFKELPTDHRK